jgi:hypothetical protein
MSAPAQINTQLFEQQGAPQQQGTQQQAAPAMAAATNEGALKGNPPTPFTGERSKSRGFLNAFNLFKETNCHNETMRNPYSRVTSALTYMTSDLMESWKEDQLQQLQNRVAAGTLDTDDVMIQHPNFSFPLHHTQAPLPHPQHQQPQPILHPHQ